MSEIETHARDVAPEERLDFAPSSPQRRGWLARLRVAEPDDKPADSALGAPASVRRRPSGYLISFLALVALPALAAAVYFVVFASDQFVAESRFAVHGMATDAVSDSSKTKKATTSSSLTSGLSSSNEDSYLVAAYVRSRACMDEVSRTLPLRDVFRRPEADFVTRLEADASSEALVKYWDRMVAAYVDPPSGIVTVKVSAFRPEDAQALSQAILAASEKMANALSSRARADIMKLADSEVASSQERVVASLNALRAFRDKAGFIDPKLQAVTLTMGLEQLIVKRVRLEADYEVSSRAMSPEAPTLQALKSRLDQLDSDIAAEKAKLTSRSADPTALANVLPEYESLLVRSTFAEKLYGLAADGLERARLRAEAQTIYLDVFVPPALPQEALYPERLASSLMTAVALLVLWGIGALTAALIEDHQL